jgi:hypothetical protein
MPLLKNIFAGAYEKTNEAPTKKMETNQEFNFPRSESGCEHPLNVKCQYPQSDSES